MSLPRPQAWAGIALGGAVAAAAFAAGIDPPPVISVSEWAQAERKVSVESGSPYPGEWDNALVPYAVEPMDCLSFSDPCRDVTFKKSHQVGGTEIGINLFGYVVDQVPCTVMIVLPTIDEAKKFDNVKLTPTIEATPALAAKVRPQKRRSKSGSTMSFKRYPGGRTHLTGANSSVGLQMISARVLIAEEISGWPQDAGNRGDPLAQAEKRLTAWSARGQKRYYSSTPELTGTCRISAKYEASDQRRYYVPCPHCGTFQTLRFENLKWRSPVATHGAYFVCAASGCVIEHFEKRAMIAAGVWIKTYEYSDAAPGHVIDPGRIAAYRARDSKGRQPGFAIWQAYSPFTDWDGIVADRLESKDNPSKDKTFTQQVLGEPFEESGESPDHEKLYLRREDYPRGRIPQGGLFLTVAADVQGDRIEWAAHAWGVGLSSWLIDKGAIQGDPAGDEIWFKLDHVLARQYEDQWGKLWTADAFGIDAGYLSNKVYAFARRHHPTGKVFALDGRDGWKMPPLGTPTKKSIRFSGKKFGTALLWPVGGWDMKSELYGSLRMTIEGPDEDGIWRPGTAHHPDFCDPEHFKQLTAEFLATVERSGRPARVWKQSKGQANEQHDIAVYARALAHHLSDHMRPEDWANLAAQRGARPEDVQRDLAALWAPSATDVGQAAAGAPPGGGGERKVRATTVRGTRLRQTTPRN